MMRRGACPSLREPMQTGDGLLVRIPLREGGITPDAMIALAQAGAQFGNGLFDISARGNIQIRGLATDTVVPLAQRIEALDIAVQNGLAIAISPLAGIAADELRDPRPLAQAIQERLAERRPALNLAPKFSVTIDGGGALHLGALKADIRLIAEPDGWFIWPLDKVLADDGDAGDTVFALLECIAAHGPNVRAAALGPFPAPPPRPSARSIGLHALKDGEVALGVALLFGQIGSEVLSTFAARVAAHGGKDIRPAQRGALIATGLTSNAARKLAEDAARLGLITDVDDRRTRISACVGAPACASAHVATHDLAAIVLHSAPQLLSAASIHLSGCAKGCACTADAVFSFVGSPAGIDASRGGKPFAAPFATIPAEHFADFIRTHDFGNMPSP